MAGTKALKKIQMGREVTKGTAVAASTLWRGNGSIHDIRPVEMVDEDVGLLMPTDRSYIPKLEATLSMESIPATYQQILHLLEAGLMTATPAADGVGTDFIYTYNFPTTSIPTITTYTLEGGDNQQSEEMEYSFVESFSLEGNAGEGLMMSGEWRGRQVSSSTFTPAIAIPSVETILFQKFLLYIDTVASGWGNTAISNTLLSMSLEVNTGLKAKFTGDTGNLYFSFIQSTRPEMTLSMVFEHDGNAVAEKAAFRNETPRAIRLISTGSAFATPGTAHSNHTLILDLVGKYTEFGALGDQDGNNTYEAKLALGYNATLASAGQIVVANELSAVQ